MSSSNENYSGRRAASTPKEEPVSYDARHSQEEKLQEPSAPLDPKFRLQLDPLPEAAEQPDSETLAEPEAEAAQATPPVTGLPVGGLPVPSEAAPVPVKKRPLPPLKPRPSQNVHSGSYGQEFETEEGDEFNTQTTLFEISHGRRKAIVEGIWSTEIDGGIIESPIQPKKTRRAILAVVLVAFVLILGAGVTLWSTGTIGGAGQGNAKLTNVLPGIYQDTKPIQTSTTIKLEGNTFTSSAGSSLTVAKGVAAIGPDAKCTTTGPLDQCIAGFVELDGVSYPVHYSGDVVHDPDYAAMADFQTFNNDPVGEGILVGRTLVNYANVPTAFILFTNSEDGAGWAVQLPAEMTAEDLFAVSELFVYKP